MKVTFVTPHVGRKEPGRFDKYVHTWQFEPLPIATLMGLTPEDVETAYFDERLDPINFDEPTDLAAIAVETYTAKRAYEIAREFHKRGVTTVLGGYHVMLMPDEAQQYADCILDGYAEPLWEQMLLDATHNQLKRRYTQNRLEKYEFKMPRRDIFKDSRYFKLSCVETGRGCPFKCNFCSITAANDATYLIRPIESVVEEVAQLENKVVFFVEDNFVGNPKHTKELLRAITPLKIQWMGQGTLTMAKDEELLGLMADSGCVGMLIGFESLRADTLRLMDKRHNLAMGEYKTLIKKLHEFGIALYGTFIFGYDTESAQDIQKTAEAAIDFGLFMAALNHLVPFPGTPLYDQFKSSGKMEDNEWWLSPTVRFGDVNFTPKSMTPEELHQECMKARRKFYSFPSMIRRATNLRANTWPLKKTMAYPMINGLLHKEINEKDGLPFGNEPFRPVPIYPNDEQIPVLQSIGNSNHVSVV